MSESNSPVTLKWQEALATGGYENEVKNWRDFDRLTRLTRTWKYILEVTNLKPGDSVFEFGCGGGDKLVPLVLRGYRCSGIDCSEDVLVRCQKYVADVEKFAGKSLNIQLMCGDFLCFSLQGNYDLVINFGVIEHFIDDSERQIAIAKMFEICKPGGYVISVVPNGQHPLRERMRKEGLGGYCIPEIDYDCELMANEMRKAGAQNVQVIPYDLFSYLTITPSTHFLKLIKRAYYYFWQIVPLMLLPRQFRSRHAYGLIGIAQKPGQGLHCD